MSKPNYTSFTSESVAAGHPDKICDQISDAFLDKALQVDADARVACEALVKTVEIAGEQRTQLIIAGEISPKSALQQCEADRDEIVRETIARAGYDDPAFGVNANKLDIHWLVSKQSEDIAEGVDGRADDENHQLGAGDQGMMFGFACDETDSYMPSPIDYAHRLMRRHAALRAEKAMPELGPDAKAQVTVNYSDGQKRIDVVVLSTQHTADISSPKQLDELREKVKEQIIFAALPQHLFTEETQYHINPAGAFIQGGPVADCGLTGRKIIVDTYGGYARHGGGAFSGKDSSKVDRSAAYAARYIAKNLVAAKLVSRCEVQLSYAIGYDKPVSVAINTGGTATAPEERIRQAIDECFDLSPKGIIDMLNLKRPIYRPTAAYGHFGRDEYRGREGLFPWEKCDKIEALLARF